MLWIFALISQVIFGEELSSYVLGDKQNVYTKIAIGIPLGIGLSTIIFFGCSVFLGFNAFHLLVHTGAVSFLSYTSVTARLIKRKFKFTKPSFNQIIYFIISLILSILLTQYCYPLGNEKYNAVLYNDLEEEIALINSFYHGCNSGFANIFKIRHPFGHRFVARTRWLTAMHSGMMKIGIASTKTSIAIPSMLYIFSFCFNILQFANTVFKDNYWYSIMTLVLCLFTGGTGMFSYVTSKAQSQTGLDYVFNHGLGTTAWSHPIMNYMYAQRPAQLSLAICSALLFLIRCVKTKNVRKEMLLMGSLVGLLLPTQFPVFVSAVIFFTIRRVVEILMKSTKKVKALILNSLMFLVAAGIVIIIPTFQFFPRNTNGPLVRKESFSHDNVMKGVNFPTVQTWFEAFNVMLPLLLIAPFVLDRHDLPIFISSLVIFFIGNKNCFYYETRQNISFFYPLCVTVLITGIVGTWRWIINKTEDEEAKGVVIGIAAVLTIFSSTSAILGLKANRGRFEVLEEAKYAAAVGWVAKNTPLKAVFITDEDAFNPIPVLAGRVTYVHSDQAVMERGFRAEGRRETIARLLENPTDPSIASKVEYIVSHGSFGLYPWVNTEGTNWTVSYEANQFFVFKRNLDRKKKSKK